MTAILVYACVSTDGQTIKAQRHTIPQRYNASEDDWFIDEAKRHYQGLGAEGLRGPLRWR